MAKRILIADDSVTIQKAFAMTFGSEDVALTAARSADEGLALAQKSRPDLIIADGAMPGRSGYDLCTQIRSDPGLRGVPVYILASGQQPYDEAKGQRAGADGHLLKPWDTNLFIGSVREALSKVGSLGGGGGPAVHPPAAATSGVRSGAASLPDSAMEDDYGEISIDSGSDSVTPLPMVTAPPPSSPPRATMTSMPTVGGLPGSPPGLRPSLIPGMRPGAMPPARPGTVPVRPLANTNLGAPAAAPPRPSAPPVGRTMIGLPAANVPIPGAMRPSVPLAPLQAPRAPVAPPRPREMTPVPPVRAQVGLGEMTPMPPPRVRQMTPAPPVRAREMTPVPPAPRPREMTPVPPPRARAMTPTPPPTFSAPAVAPMVASTVEQTMAAIAAKGPEYEAIAKLSREIIEKIAWEVVPELAEAILREQIAKR
ncbi:MAG TPA: response regulator [Polyangia bacterium]|nr:response regulator [Polyangia bacterium]